MSSGKPELVEKAIIDRIWRYQFPDPPPVRAGERDMVNFFQRHPLERFILGNSSQECGGELQGMDRLRDLETRDRAPLHSEQGFRGGLYAEVGGLGQLVQAGEALGLHVAATEQQGATMKAK